MRYLAKRPDRIRATEGGCNSIRAAYLSRKWRSNWKSQRLAASLAVAREWEKRVLEGGTPQVMLSRPPGNAKGTLRPEEP